MSEAIVAKRYARALFEIAVEKQALEQFERDLSAVNAAIQGDTDVQSFLSHPKIDAKLKKETVAGVLSGKLSDEVLSLVLLLIDRGRENVLSDVAKEFAALANEARGIVNATVYTAKPLSAPEQSLLTDHLGKAIGKTVYMDNVADPSLVGGLIVRIGDHLYDGSVKGKLFRFKQALIHA
jgi:F-type H+-transporting ATPase subunit delta